MKHITRPVLSRRNNYRPMAMVRKKELFWNSMQSLGGALIILICVLSCVALGVMWDMILRAHYF